MPTPQELLSGAKKIVAGLPARLLSRLPGNKNATGAATGPPRVVIAAGIGLVVLLALVVGLLIVAVGGAADEGVLRDAAPTAATVLSRLRIEDLFVPDPRTDLRLGELKPARPRYTRWSLETIMSYWADVDPASVEYLRAVNDQWIDEWLSRVP